MAEVAGRAAVCKRRSRAGVGQTVKQTEVCVNLALLNMPLPT